MPIDELLYGLSELMQPCLLDAASLDKFIMERGLPPYVNGRLEPYMGFVMEEHLKQALAELQASYPIAPFSGEGVLRFGRRRVYYDTSAWGNVSFYRKHDYRYGGKAARTRTEIDGVYIWLGNSPVPVIFEVTRTSPNRNFEPKTRFVERLFDNEPYYCKVRLARPIESEAPGIYFSVADCGGKLYSYRKILVEDQNQYGAIALRLKEAKSATLSGLQSSSRSSL